VTSAQPPRIRTASPSGHDDDSLSLLDKG
jgi:hypothetical protein